MLFRLCIRYTNLEHVIFFHDLSSISLCIAKPQERIRATSHYKLLKACEKPLKSGSQACCKLTKTWLAYARLAFYKPAASCFEQVNFRLYCKDHTPRV